MKHYENIAGLCVTTLERAWMLPLTVASFGAGMEQLSRWVHATASTARRCGELFVSIGLPARCNPQINTYKKGLIDGLRATGAHVFTHVAAEYPRVYGALVKEVRSRGYRFAAMYDDDDLHPPDRLWRAMTAFEQGAEVVAMDGGWIADLVTGEAHQLKHTPFGATLCFDTEIVDDDLWGVGPGVDQRIWGRAAPEKRRLYGSADNYGQTIAMVHDKNTATFMRDAPAAGCQSATIELGDLFWAYYKQAWAAVRSSAVEKGVKRQGARV
jgi:hypothetical protein